MPDSLYVCRVREVSRTRARGGETSIALMFTVNKSIKLLRAFEGRANRVKGAIKGVEGTEGVVGVVGAKVKREESY
jgi:hypothetical protein